MADQPRRLPAAGNTHPDVQRFFQLKRRASPYPSGLTLEGLWQVQHALLASLQFEVIFLCPGLLRGDEARRLCLRLRAAGVPVLAVSERLLCRMVDRDGPDGIAAIAQPRPHHLADLDLNQHGRLLIADAIDLPGNLGTLIRCADGAGATAVIVSEPRIRIHHPTVVRASMATVLTMPVIATDRFTVIDWLRQRHVRIIAADPASPLHYRAADYTGRVAIVVGSERTGLATAWRKAADVMVSIPMTGIADSLNVGHAAALLMYEALHDTLPPHGTETQQPPSGATT